MSWELANEFGILVNEEAGAWHTGRVRALLTVEGTQQLLVGSDAGGVWQLFPADEAALPLSNDWDDPDIRALVQGPDPSLVFAGTARGSIFVSDVSGGGHGGIGGFRKASLAGAPRSVTPGPIWAGVVEPTTERLVLACDNGLLWADIPAPGRDYTFFAATGAAGPFSGVAVGPNGTVIGAANGSLQNGVLRGLFVGSWSGGQLVLTPAAAVQGVSTAAMGRTSLVSSAYMEKFAYAVTTQLRNPTTGWEFLAVLRTIDGGVNWTACPSANLSGMGNQGSFNQAIAVAGERNVGDYRQIYVAIGMRRGPYISKDGGDSWVEHGDDGSGSGKSPHLHADLHALLFDVGDPLRKTLFVGSDGGVAWTQDLGAHWQTKRFNKNLPILEFAGCNTRGFGGYRGGASAASYPDGLIAGGLQDNGDVWSVMRPEPTPWKPLREVGTTGDSGGDGGYVAFLASTISAPLYGLALACDADTGSPLELTEWDSSSATLAEHGPVPVAAAPGFPANPAGVKLPGPNQWAALAAIPLPHWPSRSDHMLAVCGSGSILYGYSHGVSASTWRPIATIPIPSSDWITAVASRDGSGIWVGTSGGRIFSVKPDLDPSRAGAVECGVQLPSTRGAAVLMLEARSTNVFAGFNSQLLQLRGLSFGPIAGLPTNERLGGIAYDEKGDVIYAAFDRSVWEGRDGGDRWNPFSDGLPAVPHSSEIFVAETSAGRYVHLATWGRSVFVRSI